MRKNDYHLDVQIITSGFSQEVVSAFGIPIRVDKTIEEICVEDYDALVIPGGFEEYGFYHEAFDSRFLDLIRSFDKQKKYIASICVGALSIGKSGVLFGRKATTYHLNDGIRQSQLKEYGVLVVNERIVVDNNIITSYCPQTAVDVAFLLCSWLVGKENTRVIAHAMGYFNNFE